MERQKKIDELMRDFYKYVGVIGKEKELNRVKKELDKLKAMQTPKWIIKFNNR